MIPPERLRLDMPDMAGVIPPLILLAVSITSYSRYVEGEDTTHVAAARIMQLACVLVAMLALVPTGNRFVTYARLIQSTVLALAWISKACMYALRSVHTSTTVKAYYSSSPWLYLGVETIFAIALQGPLYESKLLPECVIMAGGLTDTAIISYTAAQTTNVPWLRHFSAHLMTTTVMPLAVHLVQKYHLLGIRRTTGQSTRTAIASSDRPCSKFAKLQDGETCSPVDAKGPSEHITACVEPGSKKQGIDSANEAVDASGLPNDHSPYAKPQQALSSLIDSNVLSGPSIVSDGMLSDRTRQVNKGISVQTVSSQSGMLASLMKQVAAGKPHSVPSYQSKLVTMKHTAAIKIRTDAHPSQLPPDLAVQMEASLKYICGGSFSISSLAVRQGCVVITAEFMTATPPTAEAHSSDPYNSIMELAHSFLPFLKPIVCEGSKQLSEGEYVRVQVQGKVVRCYLDEKQDTWQLIEDEGMSDKHDRIQLRLVRPSLMTQRSRTNSTSTQAEAGEHPPTGNSSVSSAGQTDKDRQHGLLLDVMVCGESGSLDASDWKSLIRGWTAPNNKEIAHVDTWWGTTPPSTDMKTTTTTTHRRDSGSSSHGNVPTIKLLARSGDVYYDTYVMDCKETANSDVIVMTVHVAVSELGNTHHAAQNTPCIQLLTLELWSDELLLSSTSAVLPPQADACSKGNSQAASLRKQCWWWGSRPATVTAAMSDLQQLQDKLWCMDDPESVGSYHQLVNDLSIFMMSVRDASVASSACRMQAGNASLPAAQLPHSILNKKQLQQLASDLIGYTQQSGMVNLKALLEQQMLHITRKKYSGPIALIGKYSPSRIGSFVRRFKTSIVGFSCYGCEQFYKQQLQHHLAQVQAMYSIFVLLSGFAAIVRSARSNDVGHGLLCVTWMMPSVLVMAHHIRQSSRRAGRPALTCSPASTLSLLMTAVNWASMALGLVKAPSFVLSVYQTPINIPIHIFLAGGEQLPSSAFLPAPLVFAAAVCVAASATSLHQDHNSGWLIGLTYFLVTVVARLLIDMRLRALLVPCRRTTSC